MAQAQHIILLPKNNYFQWAKAVKDYTIKFNTNITSDPETCGELPNNVITIANPSNGFGRDIITWFQHNCPTARLDVIDAETPDEFEELLSVRIRKNSEFGY